MEQRASHMSQLGLSDPLIMHKSTDVLAGYVRRVAAISSFISGIKKHDGEALEGITAC
jgi:hypothetical protein